jgi:hypothetical protein
MRDIFFLLLEQLDFFVCFLLLLLWLLLLFIISIEKIFLFEYFDEILSFMVEIRIIDMKDSYEKEVTI